MRLSLLENSIAAAIFIASPARNGTTQTETAAEKWVSVTAIYQSVPKRYNTAVEITYQIGASAFLGNLCKRYEAAAAQIIYPIMYPPVGPAITEKPPLTPENTGSPSAPKRT